MGPRESETAKEAAIPVTPDADSMAWLTVACGRETERAVNAWHGGRKYRSLRTRIQGAA